VFHRQVENLESVTRYQSAIYFSIVPRTVFRSRGSSVVATIEPPVPTVDVHCPQQSRADPLLRYWRRPVLPRYKPDIGELHRDKLDAAHKGLCVVCELMPPVGLKLIREDTVHSFAGQVVPARPATADTSRSR
jgi:hypothetical protein